MKYLAALICIRFCNYFLKTPGQFAPWQQNPPFTAQALQANISSQADDFPFEAATGMGFTQSHDCVQLQTRQHGGHYNMGWYNRWTGPGMLFDLTLPSLISRIFVLLIAFAVHEFAHAWTADRFGDLTPRSNGRLTLNPLAHLDPMGSLMLIVVGFGWARPVEVNPYALARRSPSAMMWVSLAGPVSNLLMAMLAAIPFRVGLVSTFVAFTSPGNILPSLDKLLYEFVLINLILMLFNLIPISPLDGEKIAYHLLPPSGQQVMDNIRPYGPLILLALLFIVPYLGFDVLGFILGQPMRALLGLLVG